MESSPRGAETAQASRGGGGGVGQGGLAAKEPHNPHLAARWEGDRGACVRLRCSRACVRLRFFRPCALDGPADDDDDDDADDDDDDDDLFFHRRKRVPALRI